MKILIAEDDLLLRKALAINFEKEGDAVVSAANGEEALGVAADNTDTGLIVCDIMMPSISGPTFILMLKRIFGKNIPKIIVISSVKEGDAFLNKIDIPYDYFINKPIDFNLLNQLVKKLKEE